MWRKTRLIQARPCFGGTGRTGRTGRKGGKGEMSETGEKGGTRGKGRGKRSFNADQNG